MQRYDNQNLQKASTLVNIGNIVEVSDSNLNFYMHTDIKYKKFKKMRSIYFNYFRYDTNCENISL